MSYIRDYVVTVQITVAAVGTTIIYAVSYSEDN